MKNANTLQSARSSAGPAEDTLGGLVKAYPSRPLGRLGWLTHFLPAVLALALPLYVGYTRFVEGYTHFGPAAADRWSRPWLALTTFSLTVVALLILARWWSVRTGVWVCERGLRVRLSPLRWREIPWNELAGISTVLSRPEFFGLAGRTRLNVTLFPSVGKPASLNPEIMDLPELAQSVREKLYPRLASSLQAEYQAGRWLYFGPVAVHARGLQTDVTRRRRKPVTIPWEAVGQLSVQGGKLVIDLRQPVTGAALKPIPVAKIPNLELLLNLIQQGVAA